MKVLYKPKIVKLDKNNALLTFELHPTNDPEVTMLRRTIRLSQQTIAAIEILPTADEQFIACRNEMLKGDASYQADWETERAAKSSSVVAMLGDFVGHEFPATTEEELDTLTLPNEPESGEVIF